MAKTLYLDYLISAGGIEGYAGIYVNEAARSTNTSRFCVVRDARSPLVASSFGIVPCAGQYDLSAQVTNPELFLHQFLTDNKATNTCQVITYGSDVWEGMVREWIDTALYRAGLDMPQALVEPLFADLVYGSAVNRKRVPAAKSDNFYHIFEAFGLTHETPAEALKVIYEASKNDS
jgi:hypothetical protein